MKLSKCSMKTFSPLLTFLVAGHNVEEAEAQSEEAQHGAESAAGAGHCACAGEQGSGERAPGPHPAVLPAPQAGGPL